MAWYKPFSWSWFTPKKPLFWFPPKKTPLPGEVWEMSPNLEDPFPPRQKPLVAVEILDVRSDWVKFSILDGKLGIEMRAEIYIFLEVYSLRADTQAPELG